MSLGATSFLGGSHLLSNACTKPFGQLLDDPDLFTQVVADSFDPAGVVDDPVHARVGVA